MTGNSTDGAMLVGSSWAAVTAAMSAAMSSMTTTSSSTATEKAK